MYDYIMEGVEEERARLDSQHILLKKSAGNVLLEHSIALPSAGLKVLDMATSTGVWLLDMSQNLPPTAEFIGLYVSDANFMQRDKLPPNVTLGVHDILSHCQ